MVVQLGSVITFEKIQPSPIAVQWQQNFRQRSKNFYFIMFIVDASKVGGYLAVEDAYWHIFCSMVQDVPNTSGWKSTNQKGQLTVTKDFRYGQNKEATFRFLVLGDKSDNIYQHRFAEAFNNFNSADEFQNFARQCGALIDMYLQIDFTDKMKAYIGDPLRNF